MERQNFAHYLPNLNLQNHQSHHMIYFDKKYPTYHKLHFSFSSSAGRPREASGDGRGGAGAAAVRGEGRRRVVQARDGQRQVQGCHPVHRIGKKTVKGSNRVRKGWVQRASNHATNPNNILSRQLVKAGVQRLQHANESWREKVGRHR